MRTNSVLIPRYPRTVNGSGASRPATRLLAMLEVLQARGTVSGRELAERLEVDPRTVRRYAVKLEELGIPVETERGPYGGYRLRPGFKLPPLMLTDDEATAVVLGLVVSRQTGISTAGSAVDEASRRSCGCSRPSSAIGSAPSRGAWGGPGRRGSRSRRRPRSSSRSPPRSVRSGAP